MKKQQTLRNISRSQKHRRILYRMFFIEEKSRGILSGLVIGLFAFGTLCLSSRQAELPIGFGWKGFLCIVDGLLFFTAVFSLTKLWFFVRNRSGFADFYRRYELRRNYYELRRTAQQRLSRIPGKIAELEEEAVAVRRILSVRLADLKRKEAKK